jgi:thiamine biosynthesis protein ThiI
MHPDSAIAHDRILIHYSEIGTKGTNRRYFETALCRNVQGALSGLGAGTVRREAGRLVARLAEDADLSGIQARLSQVPGVAWHAPARTLPSEIDAITEAVVAMALPHPKETFRVSARRADKDFPMDSLAVNRHVGRAVVEATGRSVSLDHAAYAYGVEIDRRRSYAYWDRRPGCGGLPVGTQGPLVALVSGGIDSPVAAFRMMLRGCRIHLVHFLNYSVGSARVSEKVRDLARRLSLYHGPLTLTILPFEDLQREIVMVVPAKHRMIVYRRMMLRIAEEIREEVGAHGFVTGDSVGQVASQTLENLRAIHDAADWPVYSPLAGMDKNEITDQARAIGTYEISIRPGEDCCSFLVARHPETRADLEEIRALERFDPGPGIRDALERRQEETFRPAAPEREG